MYVQGAQRTYGETHKHTCQYAFSLFFSLTSPFFFLELRNRSTLIIPDMKMVLSMTFQNLISLLQGCPLNIEKSEMFVLVFPGVECFKITWGCHQTSCTLDAPQKNYNTAVCGEPVFPQFFRIRPVILMSPKFEKDCNSYLKKYLLGRVGPTRKHFEVT